LLFLGQSFGTRHVKNTIKGSEDLAYSLLSTKNLSQKIGKISSWRWHPGPSNKCLNLRL